MLCRFAYSSKYQKVEKHNMIRKIINKQILAFNMLTSVLTGIFTVLVRYDWALNDVSYNNFLFIHDDDISSIGFHTLISVMNVVLLFPFAMAMLSDHKKTNLIYVLPRLSNSVCFYFIKFLQIALLCFIESLCYNTAMLLLYCFLGAIAEPVKQLLIIYIYTVVINFLIALTFVAIMQLFETIVNEKIALILIIVLFCACVVCGLLLNGKLSEVFMTNYYFVTLTFENYQPLLDKIITSLALPLIITSLISILGSFIYKRSDHI